MLRRRSIAFALVDLVVTLVLIVTLSGLASLYYVDAQRQKVKGVVASELDELGRAVTTWELQHKRPVNLNDIQDSMKRRGVSPLADPRYGTLEFLTEEGRLPYTPLDPWNREYMIDPAQGIVFSGGEEGAVAPRAGLTKPYRRESKESTKIFEKNLTACHVPPVIAELTPCDTVLKSAKPTIRGVFYSSPGCAVDLRTNGPTKLYVDGSVVDNASYSSGQVIYTPSTPLTEDEHTVVLVVADTAGNQARKQCTFIVHTAQPDVRLLKPASGTAVKCQFPINGILLDKGISNWVLNWDFRQIAHGENEIGSNNADGSINPADIVPNFDTVDPNQPVEDGRHFVTLIEKDKSGLTFTAQSEVVVDNSPPKIQITRSPSWKNLGTAQDPIQFTTDIVRINGVARDNLMVRDVRYLITDALTGIELANQPTGGTTAVPIKWDPLDLTTSRNWGALYNAPTVEFSTLPSRGTTQQQKDAGFTFNKIPPGIYKFEVWAKDLAANDSRVANSCSQSSATLAVTTYFSVNLFTGGIAGAIFLDPPALTRGPPYTLADRIISANAGPQTSGSIIFTPLEATKTPRTTQWEVVIDDNGGDLTASGDSSFVTTLGSNKMDWWATGELPTTTGEIRVYQKAKVVCGNAAPAAKDMWYEPDSDTNQQRRAKGITRSNTATTKEPIAEGVYKARITYTNDLGQSRTKIVTFVVDKERPVDGGPTSLRAIDEKVIEFREFSGGFTFFPCSDPHLAPLADGSPRTITGFSQPAQQTGTLEFFGSAKDYPPQGVIQEVDWSITQTDPTTTLIKTIVPFAKVYPISTSQKQSNIASYGYTGVAPNGPTMATQAVSLPGQFDGRGYHVLLSITDGAGLTTTVVRNFTFNSVGPLIRQFTLQNAKGGQQLIPSNSGDLPNIHTVDGQNVLISFGAVDETRIANLSYKLFPNTPGGGSGLPIRIPNNPLNDGVDVISNFLITRDENNKEFASLPTTYQLQVFGTNSFGQQGIIFATGLAFRFLTNVSIYAPHYVPNGALNESVIKDIATTQAVWIGFDEQREIADYLFDNIKTAGVKKIFNYTGNAVRSTVNNDPDTIDQWVSNATSNKSTDVLVVLDGMPRVIWNNTVDSKLVRFMESRSEDATRAASNKTDGDAVVWIGDVPFAWTFDEFGQRKRVIGSNVKSDGHRTAYRIPAASPERFYQIDTADCKIDSTAGTLPTRYQETTPFGNGSLFLPSLSAYDPNIDFAPFGGSSLPFERQLKNVIRQPNVPIAGTRWVLSKLFTVDRNGLSNVPGGASAIQGANFVYKNLDSTGTVAHFLSAGPALSVDGDAFNDTGSVLHAVRRTIPTVGPVVREYIDRYLLNAAKPTEASRRIYFNAKTNPAFNSAISGNARDVVFWPNDLESYTNVTTITAANQDSVLWAASSARGMLYSSAKQPNFNTSFDFGSKSLFFFEPGLVDLEQKQTLADILDATLGSNGAAVAYLTQNPVADSGGPLLAAPTVFYRRLGGADPQTVTNGVTGTIPNDAQEPRVSANGDFVAFSSIAIYDTTNFPPSFGNMRAAPQSTRRIYRYSASRTGSDVYADSEVTRSRLDASSTDVAFSTKPAVSRDGRFVVFQSRNAKFPSETASLATTQLVLAYNSRPGSADPWVLGPITSDSHGDALNADMTPEAIDATFPYIVFESKVDYDNAFPNVVNTTGQDVQQNRLSDSTGAKSGAIPVTLPAKAIFLFSGSFGRPLLRIATGSGNETNPGAPRQDNDCVNPRISPDGEEVVFETRALDVKGFYANENGVLVEQTVHNITPNVNRIYRVRVRPADRAVKPAAILQRISPESVDLGLRAAPQVTN